MSAPDPRKSGRLDERVATFARRAGGKLTADRSLEAKEVRRLKGLPRGEGGTTTLLGTPLRFVDGPSFVAQWQNIFVREAFRFVPDPGRPEPRIIDAGANVGLSASYWLRDLPRCRLVAIEADPRISEVLEANLRVQGFTSATVINAAVAAEHGTMGFVATGTDVGHLARGGDADAPSPRIVEVPTVPLIDHLSERVDLLKVDVEGAELPVLEAAADHLKVVDRVIIEYHHFSGDDASTLRRLLEILDAAGFDVYAETEGRSAQPFLERELYYGMDFQMDVFGWRR